MARCQTEFPKNYSCCMTGNPAWGWLLWLDREYLEFCVLGEADKTKSNYFCTFPAMISDWRSKFHIGTKGQSDAVFPFGFVQVSHMNYYDKCLPISIPCRQSLYSHKDRPSLESNVQQDLVGPISWLSIDFTHEPQTSKSVRTCTFFEKLLACGLHIYSAFITDILSVSACSV